MGAAAVFLVRTLSWPSASNNDAWAYAAWGQAIARGEQLVYNVGTTPKPLASLLAAVVSPLPPARAMALVVALALGLLVAGLLAAGYREAGALAGAVAAVAFVLSARVDQILWFSNIDAVTAALVVTSIALRGRARIVPLVLAGLLRPEAWPACALAGYVETAGTWRRRAVWALATGILPVLLWVAFDLVFARDPLATREFVEGIGTELGGRVSRGPFDALELCARAVVSQSGPLFAVVGAVGLLVHGWRSQRQGDFPLPLAIGVVWAAALVAETVYGFRLNTRYVLPLVAVLALGWGQLLAPFPQLARQRQPVLLWAAMAAALAASALAVARMDFGALAQRVERRSLDVRGSLPAIEPVLECGRLGLDGGRHRIGPAIGRLAAATRTSLSRFERVDSRPAGRYAGILVVKGEPIRPLPAWPVRRTPLGTLAVNPDCSAPDKTRLAAHYLLRGQRP